VSGRAVRLVRDKVSGRTALADKTKELVVIALNAAITHLYAPGVRRHMLNALKLGATRDKMSREYMAASSWCPSLRRS